MSEKVTISGVELTLSEPADVDIQLLSIKQKY